MEEKLNSQASGSELAPINLTKDDGTKSGSENKGEGQYLKLRAETMGIAPKGPIDANGSGIENTTLPSRSLKQELTKNKGGVFDNAKQVNVMPMILIVTDAEAKARDQTERDYEKAQLSDLWEATLNRNPDIQFVVQRLMPSSDHNHATTVLMRLISSTICSIASSAPIVYGPNQAALVGTQMTSSMIYQMLGYKESSANKRAQIDQGQAIMLYQMVRNNADKVTETYRDYKFYAREIDSAQMRTLKLQNLIQDARAGQDAAKQLEMEYWVDRAKSDVDGAVYRARRYRQSLIDLAGNDAVCKLDQSLQDQFLAERTGTTSQNETNCRISPHQNPEKSP